MWPLLLGLGATPPHEVHRLQAWFAEVEVQLRAAPVEHLDPETRRARAEVLDALRDYAAAELFPEGRPGSWGPTFIDGHHTRCAVAALMELTGEEALAERIALEHNLAYVLDFEEDPEVLAWLDAQGLSAADAQAIQPAYEPHQDHCICGPLESEYPWAQAVVELGRTAGGFEVLRVFGQRPDSRLRAGQVYPEGWFWEAPEGPGPWLVVLDSSHRFETLPLSQPCPEVLPYPARPPALPSPEVLARVVLSDNCLAELEALDARWTYYENCTGCAASPTSWTLFSGLALWGLWGVRRRSRSRTRGPAPGSRSSGGSR